LSEDTIYLESLQRKYRELVKMFHLAQTTPAQKSLSNMIKQNQDELFEFIDKINIRHTLDFDKPSWINDNRYV